MRRPVAILTGACLFAAFVAAILLAADPPRLPDGDMLPRSAWPLGDPAAPWEPPVALREENSDRSAAAALFLRGRIAEQREDSAEALRSYQRAHRLDPPSATILRAIVPLAFELSRNHEAARYAVLAAEAQPTDFILLRQLASHLAGEGETARAIHLYELALKLPAANGNPPSPSSLVVRFELGRLLLQEGDARSAVKWFEPLRDVLLVRDPRGLAPELRKLLEQKPEITWGLLGDAFFRMGRIDEAEVLWRRAESARPQPATFALRQAKLSFAREQPSAALGHLATFFDSGKEEGSEEGVELLEKAITADRQGKADAAAEFERRLKEFHERLPGQRAVAMRWAAVLAARGDWEEVDRLTTAIVSRSPDVASERRWIEARRMRGDADRLLAALGSVVSRRVSLDALGSELAALKKETALLDKLLAAAEQQKSLPPDARPGDSLLAAGFLAMEAGRAEVGDALIEAAIAAKKPGKGIALLAAGLAWSSAGHEAKAAAIWQRAIAERALPEKMADLHYYLAGCLALSGKPDEALQAAQRGLELQPDSLSMQLRPLWVLEIAGRNDAAEQGYKALLKKLDAQHDTESLRVALREVRMSLSHLAVLAGRQSEAEEWLEEALDEYPEDPGSLNDLGYLWADRGVHLARAQRMIERAVEANPENASYRDSLGWVLFRRGEVGRAVEELRKAANSSSPGGIVWDHLGDACFAAGKREEAISAWKNAAAAFVREKRPKEATATEAKIAKAGAPQ